MSKDKLEKYIETSMIGLLTILVIPACVLYFPFYLVGKAYLETIKFIRRRTDKE